MELGKKLITLRNQKNVSQESVAEDYTFRGPLLFRNGDFTYHCQVNGAFDWVSGNEDIFPNGKKIYECVFHGGIIK